MVLKKWNFYMMTFMIFILTEYSAFMITYLVLNFHGILGLVCTK